MNSREASAVKGIFPGNGIAATFQTTKSVCAKYRAELEFVFYHFRGRQESVCAKYSAKANSIMNAWQRTSVRRLGERIRKLRRAEGLATDRPCRAFRRPRGPHLRLGTRNPRAGIAHTEQNRNGSRNNALGTAEGTLKLALVQQQIHLSEIVACESRNTKKRIALYCD